MQGSKWLNVSSVTFVSLYNHKTIVCKQCQMMKTMYFQLRKVEHSALLCLSECVLFQTFMSAALRGDVEGSGSLGRHGFPVPDLNHFLPLFQEVTEGVGLFALLGH